MSRQYGAGSPAIAKPTPPPHSDGRPASTKFCKFCGATIDADCVICPQCGKQVEALRQEPAAPPQVVINNSNSSNNVNTNTARAYARAGGGMHRGRRLKKWTAFWLCLFAGYIGAHKFYEGRIGRGILYMFTFGLFGFGWIIDCIRILGIPGRYYYVDGSGYYAE